MRSLLPTLTMLALLAAAPLALAQEEKPDNSTRPDNAAWTEDCPPDMMCAASDEEPSRGPENGTCENCRGEPYGDEACIECSGPAPGSGTCMDGADAGEACDDNVQYLGGQPPETDASPVSAPASDGTNAVPGASFLVVVAGFALAILVLARRG